MIQAIADYYVALDVKVKKPQKMLENVIKQINSGICNQAFSAKGQKLEDESFIGK